MSLWVRLTKSGTGSVGVIFAGLVYAVKSALFIAEAILGYGQHFILDGDLAVSVEFWAITYEIMNFNHHHHPLPAQLYHGWGDRKEKTMEEIKITPEESDMLLHGREYKPGEEGELTDTAAEHEAARAAENVSDSDTEKRAHIEYVIEKEYEYAMRILKHYYNLLREKAGFPYDSDNDAEIEGCIEAIKKATEWQIKLALMGNGIKQNGGNYGKAD